MVGEDHVLMPCKCGLRSLVIGGCHQVVAMGGLQGFKITPTNLMKISYAKR